MLSLAQVKVGSKILFRDAPHEVVFVNHIKQGRGQAKLDCKLRSLLTQAIFEQTFQGNDRVEEASLQYSAATYLYREGELAQVMIADTFEQEAVKLPEDRFKFLKEGQPIDLLFWQDKVIDVKLPKKVEMEITYTEPAVSGNTVNAALKPATLETGATVNVPLFVKTGDRITVNTETGQYDSRA
ncbi:elongation factor P [Candidatus Berkelbacteria bacterium RIFCSPLOWO2_01_FULL_50_28]|uniref:Elongation factor P n=1 Tax=Candidatus Berkelbacteria bacterium RIFCSPLOWO2_01_FULL_50_28 TaxID=1797471 RepID=A0A1F5EB16_9BACT|nr:MAG: elongation factor P [Candidatus Berkelbacteria bacterium RIFCSPHIGHO2_01_FULL_50_36]OGD62108.1 MAG: elongation factor P [Candidatus Berkelbacteria bacterium RIFCSPHIGHO2_12_FULL_50_11]OGD64599.1 MAG: elongation factor P [Candidatus Berkelbacteria bacterium RIFCSPLOWO2_01_FULL_50_28]